MFRANPPAQPSTPSRTRTTPPAPRPARGRTAVAELTKLRTLPGLVWVFAATVIATAVSAGGLTASSDTVPSAAASALALVPFVQIGFILLGVMSFTHEYAGKQIYASLVAVPQRVSLALTKVWVLGTVALGTALLSLGTALGTAALVLWLRDGSVDTSAAAGLADSTWSVATSGEWWQLAGAACYLTLIAVLVQAIAMICRTLIPSLVVSLLLLVVLPPLVTQSPAIAKWLPDQAGSALYLPDGAASFRPLAGSLVLLGWVAVLGTTALIRFAKRDPSDG